MHRHSHLRTTKVRIPQYTVFSVVACPNRSARSCGDISRQYASCCRKEEEDIAICILTCRQYTRSSNSDTGEASMCMVAEAWFLWCRKYGLWAVTIFLSGAEIHDFALVDAW